MTVMPCSAASISSTRGLLARRRSRQRVQCQQRDADDDGRVGHVEDRPPVRVIAKNRRNQRRTLADAIDQVADRAAELQAERQVQAEPERGR